MVHDEGKSKEQANFGGPWTERKLEALVKYLNAYMIIMRHNRTAKEYLHTTYVDAFAGVGRRYTKPAANASVVLEGLEGFVESDVREFYEGSALRALQIKEPFDRYVFVDSSEEAVSELEKLKAEFKNIAIEVACADANDYLREFCAKMTPVDRAVVFLDPFGMQTEWATIEAIAGTRKIDLWALVPLCQALLRMMPKDALPPPQWSDRLSRFLGGEDWRSLYCRQPTMTLFGPKETVVRGGWPAMQNLIVKRWESVFAGVLKTPIVLRNRNNCPLYALFFGVSNPRAVKAALNIAVDLARDFEDGG